jgi:hypothetical protein
VTAENPWTWACLTTVNPGPGSMRRPKVSRPGANARAPRRHDLRRVCRRAGATRRAVDAPQGAGRHATDHGRVVIAKGRSMDRRHRARPAATAVLLLALAAAPAAHAQSRGELLYATHCLECHTTQMHWRERKLATDWASLREQVRRWQAAALLDWSEQDVREVARHLNETIYRFAPPAGPVGGREDPRAQRLAAAPAP